MIEEEWLTSQAVEHRLRVRYNETDQAGIVYHANFYVWFHEARDVAFRTWTERATKDWIWSEDIVREVISRGRTVGIDSLEDIGYRFLIIDTSCRHIAPARYGDEVVVSVIPCRTIVAKMKFAYKVRNAKTQRLLAEGRTTSAILDKSGRMLIKMPSDFGWFFQGAEGLKTA